MKTSITHSKRRTLQKEFSFTKNGYVYVVKKYKVSRYFSDSELDLEGIKLPKFSEKEAREAAEAVKQIAEELESGAYSKNYSAMGFVARNIPFDSLFQQTVEYSTRTLAGIAQKNDIGVSVQDIKSLEIRLKEKIQTLFEEVKTPLKDSPDISKVSLLMFVFAALLFVSVCMYIFYSAYFGEALKSPLVAFVKWLGYKVAAVAFTKVMVLLLGVISFVGIVLAIAYSKMSKERKEKIKQSLKSLKFTNNKLIDYLESLRQYPTAASARFLYSTLVNLEKRLDSTLGIRSSTNSKRRYYSSDEFLVDDGSGNTISADALADQIFKELVTPVEEAVTQAVSQ